MATVRDHWEYYEETPAEAKAADRREIWFLVGQLATITGVILFFVWFATLVRTETENRADLAECADAYVVEGRDAATARYMCERGL